MNKEKFKVTKHWQQKCCYLFDCAVPKVTLRRKVPKAIENNISLTGGNIDYILDGVNKYLMALAKEQIRLAFEQSQKEVDDLHQRTKEGIETARLEGKQIGQIKGAKLTTKKSKMAKEIIEKHSQDFDGTLADEDVRKLAGISRNTYYKYKKELKQKEREKR